MRTVMAKTRLTRVGLRNIIREEMERQAQLGIDEDREMPENTYNNYRQLVDEGKVKPGKKRKAKSKELESSELYEKIIL